MAWGEAGFVTDSLTPTHVNTSHFQLGKDFLSTKPKTVATEEKANLLDYIKTSQVHKTL